MDKKTKKLITLLDEYPVNDAEARIKAALGWTSKKIQEEIDKLISQKLIEKLNLDKQYYWHTENVTKDMIDIELAIQLDTSACHRFSLKKDKTYITTASQSLQDKTKS